MKLIITIFATLLFFVLIQTESIAQQAIELNTIDSNEKQIAAETLSGQPLKRTYYSLNKDAFQYPEMKKGDRIAVQISHSDKSTLTVERAEKYTRNTISYIAREEGNPESSFTFTYSEGRLHGLFHRSHEDVYFFDYDQEAGRHYVSFSSSYYDDEQFCSIHELQSAGEELPFGESAKKRGKSDSVSSFPYTSNLSSIQSSLGDDITIDILIPYTENARLWAENSSFNSIETIIANAVANSQNALDNSGVLINLRVVHYYETAYTEDSKDKLEEEDEGYVSSGSHLRRLTRNPDIPLELCGGRAGCMETDYDGFMEEVHPLRDQYGADLVAAILSEPNTGGIAWMNTSIAGNPVYGFSVNRVQQIATGYTLIHEIGHNLGNAHARNQNESAAGDFGGVFVYSAGNRFSTTSDNYATVMAYAQDGFQGIPYFSNPDIQFSGISTGNPVTFTGDAGPSDNALSMNQLKRVIASYRTTLSDPPGMGLEETSISVSLDQENSTATVPVMIKNNGDSDLVWDIDFDINSNVLSKQNVHVNSEFIEPVADPHFNGGLSISTHLPVNNNGIIFSTVFDASEGFSTGDFTALGGWRAFNADAPLEISDENPSSGNLHLRLPRRPDVSGTMFVRSTFFGPQPMGEYAVKFDLATYNLNIAGDGESFAVYVYDADNSSRSAGILVSNGSVLVLNINEKGEEGFTSTGNPFPDDGSYQAIEIRYNPDNRTVDYFMNGSKIASNSYPAGRKPDYIHVGHGNSVSGSYMDIDNIEVKRIHSPFKWLEVSRTAGVVPPSSAQTTDLTLSAMDVETGNYETVILVKSNDPANPVVEVPVSANIEMATGAISAAEVPDRVSLSQNYPNPFNPSTRIQFSLDQSSDVKLEIFNAVGQKVATLVEERLHAGKHERIFKADIFSSGVYFYRLQTPDQSITRQMILIK